MATTTEKLWNSNYVKAWLANVCICFSFMLLTPLLPIYLSETFGANNQVIGIVLSGYTIVALITRSFSGFIVDSYPRKRVLLISFFVFFIFFAGYIVAGSLLLFAIIRTMHGAPYGTVTVSNSTVAIDVLNSSRRNEGIGYYGLSNNLATAISPSVAIWIYHTTHNFDILFLIAMIVAGIGLFLSSLIKMAPREIVRDKQRISLDRFFLTKGWPQALNMVCFSLSYGVISTYVAIYGKEQLGIEGGSALFFFLLALGLMVSRLTGSKALREGHVAHNATIGVCVSIFGYIMFALLPNEIGYYGAAIIIGLGNGHMYPAYQTMFVNLAPNTRRGTASSSILVAWDIGIGLGVLFGGILSERIDYFAAFIFAAIINLIGVFLHVFFTRRHYEANKLR